MTAFMEESGVDALKGHSLVKESLHSHLKTKIPSQIHFLPLKLSHRQIRNFPTNQYCLIIDSNIYTAGKVIDNFIRRGGDESMR
jgi:hypothetical protein